MIDQSQSFSFLYISAVVCSLCLKPLDCRSVFSVPVTQPHCFGVISFLVSEQEMFSNTDRYCDSRQMIDEFFNGNAATDAKEDDADSHHTLATLASNVLRGGRQMQHGCSVFAIKCQNLVSFPGLPLGLWTNHMISNHFIFHFILCHIISTL